MTKSSPSRIRRRNIRKAAQAEAEKIGPAEARRKLAEWAARGGNVQLLRGPSTLGADMLKLTDWAHQEIERVTNGRR